MAGVYSNVFRWASAVRLATCVCRQSLSAAGVTFEINIDQRKHYSGVEGHVVHSQPSIASVVGKKKKKSDGFKNVNSNFGFWLDVFVESRFYPVFCLSLENDASAVTCVFCVWPEDNLSSSSLSVPLICESSNPRGVEQWKCAHFEPTLICKVSSRLKKSLFIQFRNTGSSSFFMIMAPSWNPPFLDGLCIFLLVPLENWNIEQDELFPRLLDSLWCCNSLCSFLALSSDSQMFLL